MGAGAAERVCIMMSKVVVCARGAGLTGDWRIAVTGGFARYELLVSF